MLPNLSGLRHAPAPAPTGPYVDVLGDDQVCAISQQPLGSYTRSGKAFRRNACPKGWQLLVVDPPRLEPNYYDTIELAMWLLSHAKDDNVMSPTRTGWIDNADRFACIAKAEQLLRVEKDWRDGLEAYKEFKYPTPPPEPESWELPDDDDDSMDEEEDWTEALQWEIFGEFEAFGDEMLTALMGATGSPLNEVLISWLPELLALNWGGARPLHYSRLLPLVTPVNFLEDADPTNTVYVDLSLTLRAYGVKTRTRLQALINSAYNRYKVALSVQAWMRHVSEMRGAWWHFWDENGRAALPELLESGRLHYPNTYDGLREWALQLAEEQLKELLPNMHWFELDKANVDNLLLAGWNIDAIVANVTLTLYVLLNLYWKAPFFADFRDSQARLEDLANLRNLEALPVDYLRRVMYEGSQRILDNV